MLYHFLIRFAVAIIIVMLARHLFGDTFLVGWFAYIIYSITDTLVKHSLKEEPDESK